MNFLDKVLITTLTATLVMLMGLTSMAHAGAPADSPLMTTVTVTYDGSEEQPQDTSKASVGFTVELSPSAPVLYNTIAPSNVQPTQRVEWAEDMVAQYRYTIRSTANGPDTYVLSVEWSKMNMKPMEEQNLVFHSGPITSPTSTAISDVTLGATAVAVAVTKDWDEAITVPSDGTPDQIVNGIEQGDQIGITSKITIGVGTSNEKIEDRLNYYWVKKVSDDGITASITIEKVNSQGDTPLKTDLAVGDMIHEKKTFYFVISGLKPDDEDSRSTFTATVKAASVKDEGLFDDDESVTTVYVPIPPTLATYIRNEDPISMSGVDIDAMDDEDKYFSIYDNEWFFRTPDLMKVASGDTLHYLIVQTAGSGPALTNVEVQASVPNFTSYIPGSTTLNGKGVSDSDEGDSPLVEGIAVNSTNTEEPGMIVIYQSAEVGFKVTVDGGTVVEVEEQESEPVPESEKVAWAGAGNACWDSSFNDGAGGWIIGNVINGMVQPTANNFATQNTPSPTPGQPPFECN